MSIVSPFHDACVAGCVANASLHPSAKREAPTHREAASFTPAPMRAEASAPQAAPCRARWRRLFDALLGLVSGPTLPHGDANRA